MHYRYEDSTRSHWYQDQHVQDLEQDMAEAACYPGLWKLGLKHWRFALGEMYRCPCQP